MDSNTVSFLFQVYESYAQVAQYTYSFLNPF